MKINTKYEILGPDGFVDFDGIQKLKKKTIEIFFDNKLTLRGSYNHQIFDYNGNPLLLSEIKIGDKIKSHNGFLIVNNIKKYSYKTNVFDIINSGNSHLYYSNDIISHNCDFLGSGDSVIPASVRQDIAKNRIREPIEKYMQSTLWQWKEPIQGHKYIMGVDVSGGFSDDYSSINIVDFDEMEQVLEYIGKIPPDDLATVVYKWAMFYEAFVVVDITGGMGIATSRKLQELNYKNLYFDKTNVKNIWEYNKKALEKTPGINFNNKRTQIVASFEENLRKGFGVRSTRLLHELDTFVYINGRPDHTKSAHDDSIMSLAIALYVGDISFSQLEKNTAVNKAMMEAMTLSERSYDVNKSFYSYGNTFDQIGPMIIGGQEFPQNNFLKEQYKEYSWLFKKQPKHR